MSGWGRDRSLASTMLFCGEDESGLVELPVECAHEPDHRALVGASERAHLDDDAFDELKPQVGAVEEPNLVHPPVVVGREPVDRREQVQGRRCHGTSLAREAQNAKSFTRPACRKGPGGERSLRCAARSPLGAGESYRDRAGPTALHDKTAIAREGTRNCAARRAAGQRSVTQRTALWIAVIAAQARRSRRTIRSINSRACCSSSPTLRAIASPSTSEALSSSVCNRRSDVSGMSRRRWYSTVSLDRRNQRAAPDLDRLEVRRCVARATISSGSKVGPAGAQVRRRAGCRASARSRPYCSRTRAASGGDVIAGDNRVVVGSPGPQVGNREGDQAADFGDSEATASSAQRVSACEVA
jgi:hypothetical protein